MKNKSKSRRLMAVWIGLVLTTALLTTYAFAADTDPLSIVNNLSDFIFSCIKAIGIIKRRCLRCSCAARKAKSVVRFSFRLEEFFAFHFAQAMKFKIFALRMP